MRQLLFRNVIWTAVGLTAAMLVTAPALAAQNETERVDRTIPFAAGGTVTLKNFSGEVHITGADRDQVVIHAVRRAPRERLDRIKLDIQTSGTHLTIEANKKVDDSWFHHDNVVQTDFEIEVPRRTSLDVNVFSSPVSVTNVEGDLDATVATVRAIIEREHARPGREPVAV